MNTANTKLQSGSNNNSKVETHQKANFETVKDTSNFTLNIDIENAAFDPDAAPELARLLREIADRVENGSIGGTIRDFNGNNVGSFKKH